jgi:Fe-S-cluster containining protein
MNTEELSNKVVDEILRSGAQAHAVARDVLRAARPRLDRDTLFDLAAAGLASPLPALPGGSPRFELAAVGLAQLANDLRRPLPMITEAECRGCGACCRHVGHPMFHIDREGWFGGTPGHPVFYDDYEDGIRKAELPPELERELREYWARLFAECRRGERPYADDLGEPCIWLEEDGTCRHYAHRPSVCRDFEVGGDDCRRFRRNQGIGG